MSEILEILNEARRSGLEFRLHEGQIQCRPRGGASPELVARVRAHKGELVRMLAGPGAWAQAAACLLATVADDSLRGDLRYLFEERAAICEFDDNLSRDEAERIAYETLLQSMQSAGLLGTESKDGERVA